MDLRYPIGEFKFVAPVSESDRQACIAKIEQAPAKMRAAVAGLDESQIDTPYRPEGWTVRQVVHHVPESHLNSYTRFKLALTEDEPTIKPYFEDRWAELDDAQAPIGMSLDLLDAQHEAEYQRHCRDRQRRDIQIEIGIAIDDQPNERNHADDQRCDFPDTLPALIMLDHCQQCSDRCDHADAVDQARIERIGDERPRAQNDQQRRAENLRDGLRAAFPSIIP